MRRKVLMALVAIAALASPVSTTAVAQSTDRQSASIKFTTQKRGTSSGLRIGIDYVNPADPQAKPPAVRRIVAELASGARIDTLAPPQCRASDVELMLLGPGVCPARSQVGEGFIRLDTGLVTPARFLEADLVFINNQDQSIFVSRERLTGLRVVSRAVVERRRMTINAPVLPGTPPDFSAIDLVTERLRAFSSDGRRFITTPTSCPADRSWDNRLSFTYADGVTQTVTSRSPCRRG